MSNNCPRECGGTLGAAGECHECGYGSTLSPVPDYEAGRLFDEWFFSVPRAEMEKMGEAGVIQQAFDQWRAERSNKH